MISRPAQDAISKAALLAKKAQAKNATGTAKSFGQQRLQLMQNLALDQDGLQAGSTGEEEVVPFMDVVIASMDKLKAAAAKLEGRGASGQDDDSDSDDEQDKGKGGE